MKFIKLNSKLKKANSLSGNMKISLHYLSFLEKQKCKIFYGLKEFQLKQYLKLAKKIINSKELELNLLLLIESRLDNYLVRSNFVKTVRAARHLIAYGHIYVNQKKILRPSYICKQGDFISINPTSKSILNHVKQTVYNLSYFKRFCFNSNLILCYKTCRIFIFRNLYPREIRLRIKNYLLINFYKNLV